MTTLCDVLNESVKLSFRVAGDSPSPTDIVTDLMALPEMEQIKRALREFAKMDPDYWHTDEGRVDATVRAWVMS